MAAIIIPQVTHHSHHGTPLFFLILITPFSYYICLIILSQGGEWYGVF